MQAIYSNNDFRNYRTLSHSGRIGMHWYERNGPPYPLSRDQLNSEQRRTGGVSDSAKEVYGRDGRIENPSAKTKSKFQEWNEKRKAKKEEHERKITERQKAEQEKLAKTEEAARQKMREEEERNEKLRRERFETNKQAAINAADKKWVQRNFSDLTNKEIEDALTRMDLKQKLDKVPEEKVKKATDKLEDLVDTVGKITTWSHTAVRAYNTVASIYNSTHDEKEKWPIVDTSKIQNFGNQGGKNNKNKGNNGGNQQQNQNQNQNKNNNK